ncbi:MAG: ParB N-terminal domain-containing protein [Phycisphaerales bacterium]|nr:ParB N-terminal domain-containing protein [Phycisphaerales bacterium]
MRPYDKNPRRNDPAVEAVAKSIADFGFFQPIVVDGEGVIVVGHARYKAAQRLGLARLPMHEVADRVYAPGLWGSERRYITPSNGAQCRAGCESCQPFDAQGTPPETSAASWPTFRRVREGGRPRSGPASSRSEGGGIAASGDGMGLWAPARTARRCRSAPFATRVRESRRAGPRRRRRGAGGRRRAVASWPLQRW